MQVNVAGLRRNIKNIACNYTEAQIKVREATSNDPWGPSAVILSEIADLTYNVVEFPKIMEMIWRRLNDTGKNWRHVKKALILMEYLIKTGVEKCVKQCRENIFAIEALREFAYYEEGKDYGRHVREKANQLVNLLRDNERLRSERSKALKAKERFASISSGFGYNDEIPAFRSNSELESVRPKTFDEEEMQLKLALDISREEAQQEQMKRQTDDVRLKLALEQSERDFQNRQTRQERTEPKSHLMDLLDISLGAASSSRSKNNLDPWTALPDGHTRMPEPWHPDLNKQNDPWQPAPVTLHKTIDSTCRESLPQLVPYGWVDTNINILNSAWPTPINTQPSSSSAFNEIESNNEIVTNTAALEEPNAALNCKNDDLFEDLSSPTTPLPIDRAANNTPQAYNTSPYVPSTSLNPFL